MLVPAASLAERPAVLRGAVLGAVGLGLGALAVFLTIAALTPDSALVEVPMVLAADRLSPVLGTVYSFVLLAEVYTTAVSSLFGLVARVATGGTRRFAILTVLVGAVAAGAGAAGFSTIVATVYPLVGYAGFLLLASLLWARLRGRV